MPESTDIIDNLDEMIRLCHQKIETMTKLQKALLLADLLGVPPKNLKEPVRFVVRDGDSLLMPWVGAVLSARVGNAPYEDFKLTDVDRRLWPEKTRTAYERWEKTQKNRKSNQV